MNDLILKYIIENDTAGLANYLAYTHSTRYHEGYQRWDALKNLFDKNTKPEKEFVEKTIKYMLNSNDQKIYKSGIMIARLIDTPIINKRLLELFDYENENKIENEKELLLITILQLDLNVDWLIYLDEVVRRNLLLNFLAGSRRKSLEQSLKKLQLLEKYYIEADKKNKNQVKKKFLLLINDDYLLKLFAEYLNINNKSNEFIFLLNRYLKRGVVYNKIVFEINVLITTAKNISRR